MPLRKSTGSLQKKQKNFYLKHAIDQDKFNAENKLIAESQEQELLNISFKYLDKALEEAKKRRDEEAKAERARLEAELKADEEATAIRERDKLAKSQRNILNTTPGSRAELDARIAYLKEQMRQEIAFKDLTNEEILLKQADFNEQVKNLNAQYIQKEIEDVLTFVGYFQSALDSFNQALTNKENAQFNKEKSINDKKKAGFKNQLDNKLLSQAQYDKKTQVLQDTQDKKERELRRKQAERDKALNLFNAIVSNAAAIVKTMTSVPFPFNIPLAIAQGIAGGLQVAAISNTPLPELGTGDWVRTGDKHSDASGGIIAKIERDEAVIKASAMTDKNTYTVTGTTAQITSALNSRAGGANWAGGAIVQMPKWRSEQPASINPNLPRIMEQGGIVRPLDPSRDPLVGNDEVAALMRKNNQLLQDVIDATKDKADSLHAVVSIKEFDKQRKLYDQSKKASGLG